MCELAQADAASPDPVKALVAEHLGSGGQRVRARLGLFAAHRLKLSPDTAVAIASCCELIHNASLLHDDIQDQDHQRRGAPAAWVAHSPALAMCGGVLLLSAAYRALADADTSVESLLRHVHARTADLIHGQAQDLSMIVQHSSLAGYMTMAAGKSGSLLALPLELAMLCAGHRSDMVKAQAAGEAFAVAYQMADDLNDFLADGQLGHANAIHLLLSQGHAQHGALNKIKHTIRNKLAESRALAERLPQGSGQLLIHLADELAKSIHLGEPHADLGVKPA